MYLTNKDLFHLASDISIYDIAKYNAADPTNLSQEEEYRISKINEELYNNRLNMFFEEVDKLRDRFGIHCPFYTK